VERALIVVSPSDVIDRGSPVDGAADCALSGEGGKIYPREQIAMNMSRRRQRKKKKMEEEEEEEEEEESVED